VARKTVIPEGEGLKYCPRCGVVKGVEDFSEQASRPDGRSQYCRECRLEYETEYRKQRAEDRIRLREEALTAYDHTCISCGAKGTHRTLKFAENSVVFYRRLKQKNYPPEEGPLCLNCKEEAL